MSNPGQAVLSIGGAIVGFVFGGPAGAAWGFQLGGLAGSALFPTDLGTVSGPRLEDLSVQTSTVGAPVPLVFGTFALSGNVIWSSGIIETVSRKRQGGKGGPTQTVKTFTYKVNCAVGVCEGEIKGIRRIWADAKLIYDTRPQQDGESESDYTARIAANSDLLDNMEIYLGSQTQLPDPTIESFEGAGNVSGFRGLAYVVFSEFQLADYGNRIPNFRFEVSGESRSEIVGAYNPGYFPLMDVSQRDPRKSTRGWEYNTTYGVNVTAPGGVLTTVMSNDGGGPWVDNIAEALSYRSSVIPYQDAVQGWTFINTMTMVGSVPENYRKGFFPCAGSHAFDSNGTMYFDFFFSAIAGLETVCIDVLAGESVEDYLEANPGLVHLVNANISIAGFNPGVYTRVAYDAPNTIAGLPADTAGSSFSEFWKILYIPDTVLKARRKLMAPLNPCAYATEISADGQWCRVGMYWISTDDVWQYSFDGGLVGLKTYVFLSSLGVPYQLTSRPITNFQSGLVEGTFLPPDSPLNTQSFWEARYAEAVAAGDMPSGYTYGIEYPMEQMWNWSIEYEAFYTLPNKTSLSEIVRAVCLRCGLTEDQIDVTELTEPVDGYAISRVMSGRDAIAPLRSFGFFDCVESGGKLKWPVRGKAAVVDLTEDDIAAHLAGETRPPAIEIARSQEVELPRRLRVHYIQSDNNYEPGEQGASRTAAGAEEVLDVELAVVMDDAKAAQVAEVLLYSAWVERNSYKFALSHERLALEPSDAITVPIEGRQERVRLTEIEYAMPGLLSATAVRDDDGQYQSFAVGSPSSRSGSGGTGIALPGTGVLVLMDLPLLSDSHNDAGYYAAAYAAGGNSWTGAAVYRSADGGLNYTLQAVVDQEAIVGELEAALPSGPTTVIDEVNELTVRLLKSTWELESTTEPALLARANEVAIGQDNRWEIVQFMDAELIGTSPDENVWRLTGLLRGRRGTEWAVGQSQLGDRFVLLDGAVERVPLDLALVGATLKHKVVLSGGTLDGATAQDFVPEGVALEPYSVIDVSGSRDLSGNLTIAWKRRGRIGNELMSGTEIPLSEQAELYEVDVLDGNSPAAVLRTLSSTVQSVVYSEADQIADFGSPAPSEINVRIYQLSAAVGRGYATEATI